MFPEITEYDVVWADGLETAGGYSPLMHQASAAPLTISPRFGWGPEGEIFMRGRLATQVAKDPRIHLVGYGPSASTIGANRAEVAPARELLAFLQPQALPQPKGSPPGRE